MKKKRLVKKLTAVMLSAGLAVVPALASVNVAYADEILDDAGAEAGIEEEETEAAEETEAEKEETEAAEETEAEEEETEAAEETEAEEENGAAEETETEEEETEAAEETEAEVEETEAAEETEAEEEENETAEETEAEVEETEAAEETETEKEETEAAEETEAEEEETEAVDETEAEAEESEAADETEAEVEETEAADETEAEEEEPAAEEAALKIIDFADLDQTSYELEEKLVLDELLKLFPEELGVIIEDENGDVSDASVAVEWVCDDPDGYEETEWAYYLFNAEPELGEYELDADAAVPYIEVYLPAVDEAGLFDGVLDTESELVAAFADENVTEIILDESFKVSQMITVGRNVTLNLNGNTITFTEDARDTNKQANLLVTDGTLTITGEGTIKEEEAYYAPVMLNGSNSSVIVGEKVQLNGWAGVFVREGASVEMNGTIAADGAEGDPGAGIYVNGNITEGTDPLEITVTGDIESDGHGMYLAGYAYTTVSGNVTGEEAGIEIRSGELTVADGAEVVGRSKTFTYEADNNGTTTIGAGVAAVKHENAAVEVTLEKGAIVEGYYPVYELEDENVKVVNKGAELQLVTDVTYDKIVKVTDGNIIKLNLKGHTITFTENAREGNLANFLIEDGKLTLKGTGTVQEETPYYAPVMLNGKENQSEVVINENVTLKGWAGVFVRGNNSIVEMNGTINADGAEGDPGAGIYVNGTVQQGDNTPVITVNGKITSDGHGMYLAGYTTTTLGNSADISGADTGIEIRDGVLNANGGKIATTASEFSFDPNNNGTTTIGAGIAAVPHDGRNVAVAVSGATVTGIHPIYEDAANGTVDVKIPEGKLVLSGDPEISKIVEIKDQDDVTLDLNGHTITFTETARRGNVANFFIENGSFNIINTAAEGTIQEKTPYYAPIMLKGSTEAVSDYSVVTIGENVNLKGWAGVFIRQTGSTDNGVVVNLDGCYINADGAEGDPGVGVYVNGSIAPSTYPAKITMDNNTIVESDGHGMYQAGYAETEIGNAGVIGADTGIEIRSGKLIVNDVDEAEIKGEAVKFSCTANNNGTTTVGAGIAVARHDNAVIDVQVKGGSIVGYVPFYEANPSNVKAEVALSVTGGEFTVVGGQKSVESENHKHFLAGGSYSVEPEQKYIKEGLAAVQQNNWWVIGKKTIEVTDTATEIETEVTSTTDNAAALEELASFAKAPEGLAEAIDPEKIEVANATDTLEVYLVTTHTGMEGTVQTAADGTKSYIPTKLTYTVKPYAQELDADGNAVGNAFRVPNTVLNGKAITISLPVPSSVTQTSAKVVHIAEDGTKEESTVQVQTMQNADGTISKYVNVTITHFSTFEIIFTAASTEDNTGSGNSDGSGSGNSGGSGGGGGGSSSGSGKSASGPAAGGSWLLDNAGWWYRRSDGSYPVNTWEYLYYNGKYDWYHFDETGYINVGWFIDTDGHMYYLNPVSDGFMGRMYTGWVQIENSWYYFNPMTGGPMGSMLKNATTPDGYVVNAKGQWIQ